MLYNNILLKIIKLYLYFLWRSWLLSISDIILVCVRTRAIRQYQLPYHYISSYHKFFFYYFYVYFIFI